jgi:hypothetical protein
VYERRLAGGLWRRHGQDQAVEVLRAPPVGVRSAEADEVQATFPDSGGGRGHRCRRGAVVRPSSEVNAHRGAGTATGVVGQMFVEEVGDRLCRRIR